MLVYATQSRPRSFAPRCTYDNYTNYTCMQFSRYNLFILTDILSVIRNLKSCLKSLITGKTSYHNSTSLLIGLTPVYRSSPFTVLFPTELTYRCLFLYEQVSHLFFSFDPAPTCSPTSSPMQYHRPLRS